MSLRGVLRRRWLWLAAALVVGAVAAGVLVAVDWGGDEDSPAASSGIDPEKVLDARQLKLIRSAIPDPACDSAPTAAAAKGLVALEVLRLEGTCLRGSTEYLPADKVDARRKELSADQNVVVAAVPPASSTDQDDDKRGDQWTLDALGVPEKSTELPWPDGRGVVVAVIDTGVDASHSDFDGGVIARRNYEGQGALDPAGHGTHVAGIIAARRGNGGIVGVAPGVSILDVPVRLGDKNPQASSWFLGLPWAVNHGADVTNLSLGAPRSAYDEAGIEFGAAAVEFARHNGVVVVASAGNCGGGTDDRCPERNQRQIPAGYTSVLSVGAVQGDFKLAGYSTRNEDVDLVAPGGGDLLKSGQVLSTYPGGEYERMKGTSQAAPHVAAAAAIGRLVSPQATADEIRRAILDSADLDRVGKDDRDDSGAGFLDVRGVVDELRAEQPRPPAELAKRTQVAYVQDDVLSVFDGKVSHPVRKITQGRVRWIDWSADHSILYGADDQTLFTWAGPGRPRVETPCDWCADENSSPAYVEDAVVTDTGEGKPSGDLVLRITPEGTLTSYNAHTLERLGSTQLKFPRDAVGSKSLHGAVGGRAIVHETGGAHALERLWLVNPASGEVSKPYTVKGYVQGAVAVNGARDRFAVTTSWSTCGQPEGVHVLDKNLGKVAAPPPPTGVMFDELFFNGDTLYAAMSRFSIATGEGCRRTELAGLWRLKGNAWSEFNPDVDNARPFEGRAAEPETGWFATKAGEATLEPPTEEDPIEGELGPVGAFLWSTPTREELDKK